MIYRHLLLSLLFVISAVALHAQTQVQGKVTDAETGEPVAFADVVLYRGGALITGGQTDFDGNYVIGGIDGGVYDVEARFVGYQSQRQTGVQVGSNRVTNVDFLMSTASEMMEEVVITEYKNPLVQQDNTTTGGTLTSDDIANLPMKDVNALAATTAGLASTDGSTPTVRGSRASGTDYYLDGIRVSGSLIPQSEIEELTALVGGIPASFGDVSGGVISAVSKGPSQRVSGGLELETSEFLDDFDYNLVTAYLSGPIIKNANDQTVFGYRFSGQYRNTEDAFPSAVGVYRATEEAIQDLTLNPLNEDGFSRMQFERLEENGGRIQRLSARPNNLDEDLNVTAKLDWRLAGGALDVSFSGNYIDESNFFTPGGSQASTPGASNRWATFNWINNPEALNKTYRGNLRIRHRLGKRTMSVPGDGEAVKPPVIQNASYTITGGYQLRTQDLEDINHQDRIFEYGYVGSFDVEWNPVFATDMQTGVVSNGGYVPTVRGFTPNARGINPGWVALNEGQEDAQALTSVRDYRAFNGGRNTRFTSAWNYVDGPGNIYNVFQESEAARYTLDVRTNFDIVPNGVEQGRHSIEIGFMYEQRESRVYSMRPQLLYDDARLRANSFLEGVDTLFGPIRTETISRGPGLPPVLVDVFRPRFTDTTSNATFFKNMRDDLGIDYNTYVNTDAIAPEDFKLDWFTARDLTNNLGGGNNILSMYGYDHLGNRLGTDVTFDDFFADADGDGQADFMVGAWQPNYLAAYIQDRFTFRDIIFRLGLRVERFDANTKVLRDPYSLYEVISVSEFSRRNPNVAIAEGVQDDWKVYVTEDQGTEIQAFRDGERWYNPMAELQNQGSDIFGQGGTVTPYYVIDNQEDRSIQSDNFINNLDGSFEDYDPEINFAPRLSFSFPISDASNFFANYDVLYQRPTAGNVQTALDYYYFEQRANANLQNNNPALQPVQTTQYEVGFNQKISNTSALRIQAFYKEERDRIQARTLLQVASPIGNYTTFDNIDFATIKGFSFTYDMRRTGNVTLLANYTLQFADGTGSSPTAQRTLSSTGEVIRTLTPLAFDERHRFNVTLDYRYGSGKRYNGPQLFGKDILANFGANFQVTAVSGRPYTGTTQPQEFTSDGFKGSLNGSRLPWTYNVDLRLDKDFILSRGEEGKRPYNFNVYFRVQNLLDTRNEVGVYRFTGDPNDAGFLSHPNGLDQLVLAQEAEAINEGTVASFLDIYSVGALNPGFFTLPRRMYLGVIFSF